MKKIINQPQDVVSEMLDGLTYAYGDLIEKVPDFEIIQRKSPKSGKVALVSGGGSGHEPAHAGFVGEGMLSAVVCGAIFTSPTPDQIYEAIKSADEGAGVLLIIKNYSGDVMNFEMAREMAEMEEIKVELIDRFGLLPDAARNLLDIARLRQQAQKLGIRKLEGNEKGGVIEFAEKNHVNPMWLIGLLQKQPQHFRLDGPTRLKFTQELTERKTRMDWVRNFMRQLEENAIA